MSFPDSHVIDSALECLPGGEYGERAFLYFLDVERSRANRSNYPLRLLLVSIEPAPGRPIPLRRPTAGRLFRGMRASLRDTDVMGWYRQHLVAGAILTARAGQDGPETSTIIRQRVDEELRRRLGGSQGRTLRVRVIDLRAGRRHQEGSHARLGSGFNPRD